MRSAIGLLSVSEISEEIPPIGFSAAFTVAPYRGFAATWDHDWNRFISGLLAEASTFTERSRGFADLSVRTVLRDARSRALDAAIAVKVQEDNKAWPLHPFRHKQLEAELAQLREAKRTLSSVPVPESLDIATYANLESTGRHGFNVVARRWDLAAHQEVIASHPVGFADTIDAAFYRAVFTGILEQVSSLAVTVRKASCVTTGMSVQDVSEVVGFAGEASRGVPGEQMFTGSIEWDNGYCLACEFDRGILREKELVEY